MPSLVIETFTGLETRNHGALPSCGSEQSRWRSKGSSRENAVRVHFFTEIYASNLTKLEDKSKPFVFFQLHHTLTCVHKVLRVSSQTKEGLPELWETMKEFHKTMIETGELFETRRKQQRVWMWNHITQHILQVNSEFL